MLLITTFNSSFKQSTMSVLTKIDVVVGTNNFHDTKKPLTKYQISYCKFHENHTRYKTLYYSKNDIALIRVFKPIQYNDKVGKIPLETEAFNNYTTAVLTGWGDIEVRFIFK